MRWMSDYVVICQKYPIITITGAMSETVYSSDMVRFSSRDAAIDHGFQLGRSDDFNIGELRGDRLVGFSWMHEQFEDYDLTEIASQIGVRS